MYNSLKILLFFSFFFSGKKSIAQEKIKVYFLADTINISPENRILSIDDEGPYHGFLFFCKCIPVTGSESPRAFIYRSDRDPGEITIHRPSYNYISWKDLAEMLYKQKLKFDLKYDLYITEVLPDKRFKTNQVNLVKFRGGVVQ